MSRLVPTYTHARRIKMYAPTVTRPVCSWPERSEPITRSSLPVPSNRANRILPVSLDRSEPGTPL